MVLENINIFILNNKSNEHIFFIINVIAYDEYTPSVKNNMA